MATIAVPHVCRFSKTSQILDTLFPPDLKLSKIRKKFRKSLLVSEENGRRCYTPEGTVGYIFEKEKQLTQYYHKIHPYSKFREYWEIFAIVEALLSLTIRFFVSSQLQQKGFTSLKYQTVALIADFFEMTDVGLRFLTGYMDKETGNVMLETRRIFFHNIQSFQFYLILISSLPIEFFIYIYSTASHKKKMCVYSIFLKIFKTVLISKYLMHIAKIFNWSELCLRLTWVCLMMFLLSHWLSCLFYLVIYGRDFGEPTNKMDDSFTPVFRHFTVFYMISSLFLFQNTLLTKLVVSTTKDIVFCLFVLIVTDLSNIVFVGLFIELLGLRETPSIHYEEMVQEVQKFLVQENVPSYILKKVKKYFQFRFRYKYYQEQIILDTLSPPLKREIANFLCMNLLVNPNSIFRHITPEMASDLCLQMKFEVFLPGDHIIRAGRRAKKMYFIYCGTVAMFTPRGKEILHLYNGQHFGESTFSINNRYLFTAIALEVTECYVLTSHDFLKFSIDNPDHVYEIAKRVNAKRFYYKSKWTGLKD